YNHPVHLVTLERAQAIYLDPTGASVAVLFPGGWGASEGHTVTTSWDWIDQAAFIVIAF
nr:hypothetical protein [Ardenticatenia bacterium]